MTPPRILIFTPLYIHTLLEGPSSIAMLVVPGWLFPEVVPQDLNLVRVICPRSLSTHEVNPWANSLGVCPPSESDERRFLTTSAWASAAG